MRLINPELARCDNRSISPRENLQAGRPPDWFDENILDEKHLNGFTYDFFINWSSSPIKVTPVFWVKKIIQGEESDVFVNDANDDEIINLLVQNETEDYLSKMARHCKNNHFWLHFLLFREIDWANSPEDIIVIRMSLGAKRLNFDIERIDISELQRRIQIASGGPISIGRKGLIYGTSKLECYLSRTNSLYPGDVDLVITNSDLKNVALIEFKKHNLTTSIKDQKLSNYYPSPDKRKYDRLAILRNYLQDDPKLITLYYPTRNTEGSILEYISGNPGNLVSEKRILIPLPSAGESDSYESFVDLVIRFVETL